MLCKFGLESPLEPPSILSSEIALPPGIPKELDTETSLLLAEWLTVSNDTGGCTIKYVHEAGVSGSSLQFAR